MIVGEPIPKEQTVIEPSTGEKPVIKVEPPQVSYEKEKRIIIYKRILWYVLSVLESLLAFRFIIKLLGANPNNLFSILIEITTIPFLFIFINLFPPASSITGNLVLEWSTLFALQVLQTQKAN
ncbi:hypothetical protein HYU93_03425 [Candidatus Daviesbacteria bacterium]|nr:hypothetical protein [Candidatus Daviesbacteria bacterium]